MPDNDSFPEARWIACVPARTKPHAMCCTVRDAAGRPRRDTSTADWQSRSIPRMSFNRPTKVFSSVSGTALSKSATGTGSGRIDDDHAPKCADRAADYRAGTRRGAELITKSDDSSPDAAADRPIANRARRKRSSRRNGGDTSRSPTTPTSSILEARASRASPPRISESSGGRSDRCADSANAFANGWNGCATMTTDAVNCPVRCAPVP